MAGPDEMAGGAGAGGAPDAGDGMDLESLLGTSPSGETTGNDLRGGFPGQGDTNGQNAFQFAGRTWKGGQKEAEGAWNKMYGKYSESQGIVNQLKQIAQDDPELAAQLAQDPRLAGIFGKLGITGAEQSIRDAYRQGGNQQMSQEDMVREIGIERHQNRILREEWAFERKLGRPLTEREQQAVYRQIDRAENLTYEEAYFLAHREQIMKRQAQAAAGASEGQPPQALGGRPKPPPRSMPGTPAPGKKSVANMSEQEWKENLRQSGIVKELMSRGMSRE